MNTKDNAAHLEVIYRVAIHMRMMGWKAERNSSRRIWNFFRTSNDLSPKYIADIMDAIHNTPNQIAKPFCSTEEYINMFYRAFDEKYPDGISLVGIFEEYQSSGNT